MSQPRASGWHASAETPVAIGVWQHTLDDASIDRGAWEIPEPSFPTFAAAGSSIQTFARTTHMPIAMRAAFAIATAVALTLSGTKLAAQSNNELPADLVAWQGRMKTAGITAKAPHFLAAPLCPGCRTVGFFCSKPLQSIADIRGRKIAVLSMQQASDPDVRTQFSAAGTQVVGMPMGEAGPAFQFGLVDCAALMSTAVSADVPTKTQAKAEAKPGEAAEAWAATKDTTNTAVLEAFIARYKDTFFAELARARVADLKNQQATSATKGGAAKQADQRAESDRLTSVQPNVGPKGPEATGLPKEEASPSSQTTFPAEIDGCAFKTSNAGFKTVAIVASGASTAKSGAASVRTLAENNAYAIVAEIALPDTGLDFSNPLTQVMLAKPGVIFVCATNAHIFLQQAQALGLTR